jgi:hypothetical protein
MVPIGSESFREISTWWKGTKCQIRTTSNARPCLTPGYCRELVGALRAEKERPFTLKAAAIR